MPLMGIREYARHRGVSHTAVRKAIAAGRISRRRDGKIDSVRADGQWSVQTDPSKPSNSVTGDPKHRRSGRYPEPSPAVVLPEGNGNGHSNGGAETGGGGEGYAAHRALREEFAAKTAELEFRQKTGELVEVDLVRREAFRAGRVARDLVLSLAPRLSPILAATKDEGEVFAVLEGAAREICEEIARVARFGLETEEAGEA